jgi:hypothetical protein
MRSHHEALTLLIPLAGALWARIIWKRQPQPTCTAKGDL